MEENNYQKLGTRTLVYDIAANSKLPAIILIITLVMVLIKNLFGSSTAATGLTSFQDTLILWGFLTTLVVFAVTTFISWLKYTTFQFQLTNDIFKIRRGFFTKTEVAIPYRRIESVDIKRTLIHQLFGVSRINIETTIDSEATGDNKNDASDEVFPVIDHTLATTIQEELTKRANVQKMQV